MIASTTIELPNEMFAAASSYAKREHSSIVDFFANMMRRQYGYGAQLFFVNRESALVKDRKQAIPGAVEALSGIVSVPFEKKDADLIGDAIMEKYGEIQ